jgi:hypothetical protein
VLDGNGSSNGSSDTSSSSSSTDGGSSSKGAWNTDLPVSAKQDIKAEKSEDKAEEKVDQPANLGSFLQYSEQVIQRFLVAQSQAPPDEGDDEAAEGAEEEKEEEKQEENKEEEKKEEENKDEEGDNKKEEKKQKKKKDTDPAGYLDQDGNETNINDMPKKNPPGPMPANPDAALGSPMVPAGAGVPIKKGPIVKSKKVESSKTDDPVTTGKKKKKSKITEEIVVGPGGKSSGKGSTEKTKAGHDFHMNPSLHLWSLGVEEQFYFVFPFFMLLAYGSKVCGTYDERR